MTQLLEDFTVAIEIPVAWGEMDAFGHVNSVAYFRYIESGRVAYFEHLELLEYMRDTGVGPILASTSCRFMRSITYPDTLLVGTRVSQVNEDRFTMETLIVSRRQGQNIAEGQSTVVMLNYREQEKITIPDLIRRRIRDLEATRGKDDPGPCSEG